MNLKERLKEAYDNVSFNADRTWSNAPDSYVETNLELYLTEHRLEPQLEDDEGPRTVRECIPRSRLAQYSNFVYDEAREMPYTSSSSCYSDVSNFVSFPPSEPWEMPQVNQLVRLSAQKPEEGDCSPEEVYESPLMNANGFEDRILKLQITEERVKNIWKRKNLLSTSAPKTITIAFNCFTSPLKNYTLSYVDRPETQDDRSKEKWVNTISKTRDFEQLDELSKLLKKLSAGDDQEVEEEPEPPAADKLYSEVLQGASASSRRANPSTGSKSPEEGSYQDSFTNFTVLNTNRKSLREESRSEASFFKVVHNNRYVPPNKVTPAPQSPVNMFLQGEPHHTYHTHSYQHTRCYNQYQVDPHARNPTFFNNALYYQQQQGYLCAPPVPTLQRWPQPAYYLPPSPTHVQLPNWVSPAVAGNWGAVQFTDEELREEEFVEEYPLSTSLSDELEIQALEQYCNSNENFYQELERQATEQYSSSPEPD